MQATPKSELLGLDLQELTAIATNMGQPSYRGRQLFEAIYRQRVETVDQVTTLPTSVRVQLGATHRLGLPVIDKRFVSVDGTVRYLIGFADGQSVETVWMPEGDGGEQGDGSEPSYKRATICVSSQAGCAVNCQFCMTALLGLLRNLTPGEIVGQILCLLRDQDVSLEIERINLVFMGQGEPFLNYDNFKKAARLLVEGVGIPESRMTVSTAGIVPRIRDFGREPIRPKLAISLNASNDQLRDQVMPINRKWNLEALMSAAREFPLRPRERLTFEYVLLNDVNDSVQNAREVLQLIKGINAKMNLIALNPGPEIPFGTPTDERVHAFQQTLIDAGVPTFIRRPRGRDIFAACGQLKRAELTQIGA
jgi:23S rRNA (adenine2503-C2)-methyltransferase